MSTDILQTVLFILFTSTQYIVRTKYFVLFCWYFWHVEFSFSSYPARIVLHLTLLFCLLNIFIQIKDTFEKNLMSLVEVLKLFLLLKVLDGLRSFILMEAESKYCISFSRRLYANLSSTAAPVAACSDSVPPPRLGLNRRRKTVTQVFLSNSSFLYITNMIPVFLLKQ